MKLHPRFRKGESACAEMRQHAVLIGYGRAGSRTLRALKKRGIEFVVVDEDAGVIRKLIAEGIPCVHGDGSDPRTLKRAHCREARAVFCSMRRTRDAQTALNYLKDVPTEVLVRVFETSEEDRVRLAGGQPVQTADAAAEQFLRWADVNLGELNKGTLTC